MPDRYSYAETTASGATDLVSVPFNYIAVGHVHFYVKTDEEGAEYEEYDSGDISWISSGQVQLPETPTAGYGLKVQRITPIDGLLVTIQSGNLSHTELNRASTWLMYAAQERADETADALALAEEAQTFAEAAEAAQVAAEAAQGLSEDARDAASGSADDAEASNISAAAWAAAAQLAASSNLFATITEKVTGDSPFSIVLDDDDGTLFMANSSGGDLDFQLPSIALAGEGERYGIYRVFATNTVRLLRTGTDTINGVDGDYTVNAVAGELIVLLADQASPNNWIALIWSQATADGTTLTKTGSVISINLGNGNQWTGWQATPPISENTGVFDLEDRNDFDFVPSGDTEIGFSNLTNHGGQKGIIFVDNTGGHTFTFASGCYGRDGLAADISALTKFDLGYAVNAAEDEVHLYDSAELVDLS